MPLHVKLRDGFRNDTVSIEVNGHRIYNKSGVSTDLAISFADAVEIPVEEPVVTLEVSVAGSPSAHKLIRVRETPCIDVWRIDGKMELRPGKDEVPMR